MSLCLCLDALPPCARSFISFCPCREGNYDLVGNNMPVFFVRDGMKFPDMVHALKPNPKNHIQEGWRIADFFSHIPESMHMVGGVGGWVGWVLWWGTGW